MKEKKNDSSGGKYTLYEWYVSFDDIEAILREDLLIAASRNNEDLSMMKLLVPGCGNSSFCEDLARKGVCTCFSFASLCFWNQSLNFNIFTFFWSRLQQYCGH